MEGALKASCGVLSLKGQSQPEILNRLQELIVEENMAGVRLLRLKSKPRYRMQRNQFLQTHPPAIRHLSLSLGKKWLDLCFGTVL